MRKVLLLLLALAIVSPAIALTYTYQFSGNVTQLTNPNNAIPGAYLNQPFTGTFSYSSMPFSSTGIYDQMASLKITLGSFTLDHTNKPTFITVANYATTATGRQDSFSFHASGTQGLYNYSRSGINLADSTRTVFSSTALPTSLLLNSFTLAQMNLTGSKGASTFSIVGNVTTLTLIPEPATLLLLTAALPLLRRKR